MNVYDAIVVGVIAVTWLATVKMICSTIVVNSSVKNADAETIRDLLKVGKRI